MRYQYRPFRDWSDERIALMVKLCEDCHGINHNDVNALWDEMDYRTDPVKQAAAVIIDRAANECLQSVQGIGSVYIDAADMLISVCQYLINPSYHSAMSGTATKRVYHIIANQSIK